VIGCVTKERVTKPIIERFRTPEVDVTFPNRLAVCLLALSMGAPVVAQRPGAQQLPPIPDASQQEDRRREPADRALEDLMHDQARKLNKQRQQDLKRDTDKLLDLATELKKYVDKSNENVLSLDVLKKAEEIEKLARRVKDKMRGQ
jgi:hypothetical protein